MSSFSHYLMGSNNFTLVAQSIIRATTVGLDTDVHFVPMKVNYRELPDLIEILNIAEIRNFSLSTPVTHNANKCKHCIYNQLCDTNIVEE